MFSFFIEVLPLGFTGGLWILRKHTYFHIENGTHNNRYIFVLLKMKLGSGNVWGHLFVDVPITFSKEAYEIKLVVFHTGTKPWLFRTFK